MAPFHKWVGMKMLWGIVLGVGLVLQFSISPAWSCSGQFPFPDDGGPEDPVPPEEEPPPPDEEPPPPPPPDEEPTACESGLEQVTSNGIGDLLIFPYWTTEDRDTLIAIGNAFGGQAQQVVHVRFRECVNSEDVRDFTVCLSPGDIWTASLTRSIDDPSTSVLTVGNPGSCDNQTPPGFTPAPVPGQEVSVLSTCGYLEAFTVESPCGGDDVLWGVGSVVNVTGGFSSSYTATAFVDANAVDEGLSTVNNAELAQALAREGGVDKEILIARYVAGGMLNAGTQLVLTFPAGRQPGAADPISAVFFDEEENRSFSENDRQITLPHEVNECTIEDEGGVTTFRCPGTNNSQQVVGTGGSFTGGWVRLANNGLGAEEDNLDKLPVTRFPVIGLVFSRFSPATQFDQAVPLQWAAITGAGGFGGSMAFNLEEQRFIPWRLPSGTLLTPGDNATGGLPLTGGN